MSDESVEKRKKALVAAMSEERGYMPAPWAYMAEKDLDFLEAYNTLYTRGLTDGKALPIKTRELIAIAILAYRGKTDAVYEHAKGLCGMGPPSRSCWRRLKRRSCPGGRRPLGPGCGV